jgi:hypothetical protein
VVVDKVFTPVSSTQAAVKTQKLVQTVQAVRSIDAAVESLFKGKKKSAAR